MFGTNRDKQKIKIGKSRMLTLFSILWRPKGVWDGRVYVGSVEGVDFWKMKVESGAGKVPKG